MADQDGVIVAAQGGVQREDVGGQFGNQVGVVGGEIRRRIAAGERGDGAVARLGELRPEVAPGVGSVRVAVNHQCQRGARLAPSERCEGQTVGIDAQLFHAADPIALDRLATGD